MTEYYELIKALHLIAVISWMVGMLYLPRLYVYHSKVEPGSETDKIFQIMEYRLLKYIMNPAMIVSLFLGLLLIHILGIKNLGIWFHVKMFCIVILIALHGMLAKWRKDFVIGKNKYSATFYKVINEVPTLMMIIAIIAVIVKPFA